MGEPEPEPEVPAGGQSPKGSKSNTKDAEPPGQQDLRKTIKALQKELDACESGSDQHAEIVSLIESLQAQLDGKPALSTDRQLGMSIMVAGKLKRKKKKKKKKNKNKKGFFDDSYMAKEKRAAEVNRLMKLGGEMLEKAD